MTVGYWAHKVVAQGVTERVVKGVTPAYTSPTHVKKLRRFLVTTQWHHYSWHKRSQHIASLTDLVSEIEQITVANANVTKKRA